jgi:aspartate carbamoyltransferase catalytic subunit
MTGLDLISIRDLSNTAIESLFEVASSFNGTRARLSLAKDAILTTLFYEPSTRTRMSFEAAMLRLGGQVISMADPNASSAAKGETLADTVRIVESYADIIALRHPKEGAAKLAAEFCAVPVINGGDGAREHPTQTLLDLYTIYREKGRIAGVTVALCGDLKHGRTVHSLAQGLARFGARVVCIAPPGLELPADLRAMLAAQHGLTCEHAESLESPLLAECDVLYVTRLQKERFADPLEFEQMRSSYMVSRDTLTRAREDAIVLHPLPRVDELDYSLDGDPRAAYFRQAAYGVPVRMALIAALLRLVPIADLHPGADSPTLAPGFTCDNRRCITHTERGIPTATTKLADGALRCAYCEAVQEEVAV